MNSTYLFITLLIQSNQIQSFSFLRSQNQNNRKLQETQESIAVDGEFATTVDRITKNIPDLVKDAYSDWKDKYNKKYSTVIEEVYRMKVFYTNYQALSDANMTNKRYSRGLNQFADMSQEEFVLKMFGLNEVDLQTVLVQRAAARNAARNGTTTSTEEVTETQENSTYPESIDWRNEGAVTDVKSQGSCGSCWAFSATGALEALKKIKGQELTVLSEQQLMDCSTSYGNMSCSGGLMNQAFDYVKDNGITTESLYPYNGSDSDTCHSFEPDFQINGRGNVQEDSVEAMKIAVARQPISVGIAASDIGSYSSGIYDNDDCGTNLNHAVLQVGYGSEDGVEYWIIKNSWGSSWGENGYMRLAINYDETGANGTHGMCGILIYGSYPNM